MKGLSLSLWRPSHWPAGAKENVRLPLTNAGNASRFNTYPNITRGNPFDNNPEFRRIGQRLGHNAH